MVNINKILKIFEKKNLIFFLTSAFFLLIIIFISNKLYLYFFNENTEVIIDHEYTISYKFDSKRIDSNFAKKALDHKIDISIFATNCINELSKNDIFQNYIICDPYNLVFGPINTYELFESSILEIFFEELGISLNSMDEINVHFLDDFKIVFYTYGKEFDLNLLNITILNSFERFQNYEHEKVFDTHLDYLNNFFDATILMKDYDKLISFFNEFIDIPDGIKSQSVNEVLLINKKSFPRDISSIKLKEKLQAFNINRFTFLFFIAVIYIFFVITVKISKLK